MSFAAPLGHRPELDGIRAVAVLAVAVFHTELPLLRGGWVGVDVFFVLSGFLITTLLLEERERHGRIDLPAFYARRALRLLPALAALLLGLTAAVAVGVVHASALRGAPWVIGYVANWPGAAGRSLGPLTHLWSLSLEEQFYVVWPLVTLALLACTRDVRRRVAIVGAAASAIAVLRCGLYLAGVVSGHRAYFGSDMRCDALLLGCVLAFAHQAGWTTAARAARLRALLWPAVAVLVAVAVSPVSPLDGVGPLLFLPVDVAAAIVIGVAVSAPSSVRLLRWRPLVGLGVLSYGFYLWHVPVMRLIDLSPWQRLVVGVPLTLVVAIASRVLVEVPALRWKRRFERDQASAATTGAAAAYEWSNTEKHVMPQPETEGGRHPAIL